MQTTSKQSIDTPRERVKDTLFDGELVCWQHKKGYRFSMDSVLLAHFAPIRKDGRILDLGTGCGVLGLILLYRHKNAGIRITGIEKQSDLFELARINREENGFSDVFTLVAGDIADTREYFQPESFSLVVSNPPFYAKTSGRTSSGAEAQLARHQHEGGLQSFAASAAYCLENRGRAVFIYPAHLLSELLCIMKASRIEAKSLQFIYAYPGETTAARLVLFEGIKNGGTGMAVHPPCYLYEHKNGPYSAEVASMYRPERPHAAGH